jgi:transposase
MEHIKIGIDISKQWFDAFCSLKAKVKRFRNTPSGYKKLQSWLPENAHIVMEASGPYYLQLANWLNEQDIPVSVVNPLVIKRYCQMKLTRTKTDQKDAQMIAYYGVDQNPTQWKPASQARMALQQLMSVRDGLIRQQSILHGQQESFAQFPADPLVMQTLREQMQSLNEAIERIDQRLEELVVSHYESNYTGLRSIPGIGKKTAIMLICITDGFSRFESSRQLASYVGLCPRIYKSGSSINGRGSICKMGNPQLRKMLYMCSWTAKKCNPGCSEMYERMKKEGKPERVIKIAIAHKLLRQAFAVVKNGKPFDKNLAMAA